MSLWPLASGPPGLCPQVTGVGGAAPPVSLIRHIIRQRSYCYAGPQTLPLRQRVSSFAFVLDCDRMTRVLLLEKSFGTEKETYEES
jgi:hypothetical protein